MALYPYRNILHARDWLCTPTKVFFTLADAPVGVQSGFSKPKSPSDTIF